MENCVLFNSMSWMGCIAALSTCSPFGTLYLVRKTSSWMQSCGARLDPGIMRKLNILGPLQLKGHDA